MKIDILLATHNGEQYIAKQIYSLLAQTHQDWHLYVADDGSTDKTLVIIQKIMKDDNRLTILEFQEPVKNAAKNFWRLLHYSTAGYIIFCDQDDIWLESKLLLLYQEANSKFDNELPCLVYCDTYIYDNKQQIITSNTLYPITFNSFEDLLFHNGGYQGSSILFNQALKNKALDYDNKNMYIHDEIITLIAHSFGKVFFLNKSLMLYRIHDNNVIGKTHTGNVWLNRLKQLLFRSFFVIYKPSYNSKVAFYDFYKSEFNPKALKVFQEYFDYCHSNFIQRCIISLQGKYTKFRLYFIYRTVTKKLFNE